MNEQEMSAGKNLTEPANAPTRRQIIAGAALALGGLMTVVKALGQTQPPSMQETPSTGAEGKLTFLHQEVDFKASPQHIYDVLLDSKQFAACTGYPADIDPKVGGAFSTFGGLIAGRNVELISNQRIVQAWRPTSWDAGVYSMVKFELKPQGSETRVVLDHTGFPEGDFGHLNTGWHLRYWDPMKKFFA